MSTKTLKPPNATTFPLEDIVDQVRSGIVRIPRFQRGFRWQWKDVRRLFDSIVRGYPIGNLLLWERQAEAATIKIGALNIEAPAGSALWVVDGQQRLTSLASALSDEGYNDQRFGLVYNLDDEDFQRPPTQDEPWLVPLPVIFDLQRLLRWTADHQDEITPEFFDRATAIAKRIRQFTVPAYIVQQQDETILRDIFDRMNNYGKRLSRAEVFSALHSIEERDTADQPSLADIADRIDQEHEFGLIDDDTILHAILARRGPDVTREIRNEFKSDIQVAREFSGEGPAEAYRGAEQALLLAVTFLQTFGQVPHFSFLPYRYLLVVLTRFFAHFPNPQVRNITLLRRWLWRAIAAGPMAWRSWTSAMRTLASQIVPGDENISIQQLLQEVARKPALTPQIDRFRTNWADTRVLLCSLWTVGPRSFSTNEPYSRSELAESLNGAASAVNAIGTFFPRAPVERRQWASNRLIVLSGDSGEDAIQHLSTRPPSMTVEQWSTLLASQLMTEELADLLSAGEVERFLFLRQDLLQARLVKFLGQQSEQTLEDTPPLDSFDFDDPAEPEGNAVSRDL